MRTVWLSGRQDGQSDIRADYVIRNIEELRDI
jgi:hypothetical protein